MTTNGSTSTGSEPLSRYFQAVNASYDALVAAAESGSKHGNAVWSRVLEDSRAAQKEALGLSEQVLGKPADAQTYGAVLEASLKSQERALGFAKLLFDEVSSSTVDARSALEGVIAANRTAAEAAAEVARAWTGDSTFGDAWRKGVEAMSASPFASPFVTR
jgi:hypothetical protein